LINLYRIKEIDELTTFYAVVGNPIGHSKSPLIHNTAFKAKGMNACYLKFKVEELADFLKTFEMLDLQGISVTIPHKEAALECAAISSDVVTSAGVANTLSRKNGKWVADNTDIMAATSAIKDAADKAGLDIKGAKTLLVGAGGAGRGIAFGLAEAGVELYITNRTFSKAEALAKDCGAEAIENSEIVNYKFDIIANSTSVGMVPDVDKTPVPEKLAKSCRVAFDAVYTPEDTLFLKHAASGGAVVASGSQMFLRQAVIQFEIWTEGTAPVEEMAASIL
jgi:3-dehydroquinate dehydratase/shikimate dehydrogenase